MTEADKDDIDRRVSDLFWNYVPANEGEALARLHTEFGIVEE